MEGFYIWRLPLRHRKLKFLTKHTSVLDQSRVNDHGREFYAVVNLEKFVISTFLKVYWDQLKSEMLIFFTKYFFKK